MAKELPYYKFNPNEWLTGDITLESYDVQGVFINVKAYYWQSDCDLTLSKIKGRLRDASIQLERLLEAGIIKHDSKTDKITINYLKEQWDELLERHERAVSTGRKGGQASVKGRLSKPQASLKQKDIDKDKEVEEEMVSSTSSLLKHVNDLFKEFIANERWIEETAKELATEKEKIISNLYIFNNKLHTDVDLAKTKKDYATHFKNWMRKNPETKQKKPLTMTVNRELN